jgi:hypothetical protein
MPFSSSYRIFNTKEICFRQMMLREGYKSGANKASGALTVYRLALEQQWAE